jgi:hypothetical protein
LLNAKIIEWPSRKKAIFAAREFILASESVTRLPIDPIQLYKEFGWHLYTYSQAKMIVGENFVNILRKCEIDATTKPFFQKNGQINYCTLYDEEITPFNRIRFTLAHEIAHIILGHCLEDKKIRRIKPFEDEADRFAAELLAPIPILKSINATHSPSFIMEICELTPRAANNRYEDLRTWEFDSNEVSRFIPNEDLIYQFKDFIYDCNYKIHCLRCSYSYYGENLEYCPICGKSDVFFAGGFGDEGMIYDGYEVDDNGRALTCPRCDNEQLEYEGDFCNVCGSTIVNKCTKKIYYEGELIDECGTIEEGNARHCRKCGEKTTFYQQQFLKPWSVAQEELRNEIEEEEQEEINEMIGRELPF